MGDVQILSATGFIVQACCLKGDCCNHQDMRHNSNTTTIFPWTYLKKTSPSKVLERYIRCLHALMCDDFLMQTAPTMMYLGEVIWTFFLHAHSTMF